MADLGAEFEALRDELLEAATRVLASGRYVFGDELEAFEEEFARYVGRRYAVGVGSGTAALQLALAAAGLEPGSEVITATNTDSPTAAAITRAGLQVVLADVDAKTFCLDAADVERRLTRSTSAIVPVHLFGNPADMDALGELARRHDLLLIEDAALAVGAEHSGRKVGSIGDIGCFSLAPSKILGAYGDAGIVVTDDAETAERLRVLRNYGHAPEMTWSDRDLLGFGRWRVLEEGTNERLDTLQAALLRVKLRVVDERIEGRRAAAARYDALLADAAVVTPFAAPNLRHVYFAYTLLVEDRDATRTALADRGIASRLYYNPPLHLQPAYARLGMGEGSLPVAEETAGRMLALPIFPLIEDDQIERVAAAVAEIAGEESR
jgi:dTDP-4-amino-4,6-dideoxygalactose transaminase